MHIPDGYLSPSTCGVMYAFVLPFWYGALIRLKAVFSTRAAPLISLFAAFSFVVMMFNLPLPGGTTGHAVGMGIATIVLGAPASILAISIALLVQALFFGDGGISTFGANCFNMAIVGSLVAYVVYRVMGARASLTSNRRVVAAGLAGYIAINVSALLAAVEFGIQPLLFHDALGAPLYCPYPLSISIPAMMIGHLTFAGLAELIVTAGLVSYLQRADPSLLRLTAPDAPDRDAPREPGEAVRWPAARKLWLVLAIVLVLTPLGIVTAGSAWGEWSASDFENVDARREMAAASRNQAPPTQPPKGLQRLSSLWTAPISGYAPGFSKNAYFGYFASAMVGVGIIILLVLLLGRMFGARAPDTKRQRATFLEKTLSGFIRATQYAIFAEDLARSDGLLQRFDPRVKLTGALALIVACVASRRLIMLVALLLLACLLAILSRVPLKTLLIRVWLAVLGFTGLIALPAIFLTPGTVLAHVPVVNWPITMQGLRSAAFLILRAEAAGSFSLLLILCTPWVQVLKSLRFFRVPAVFVLIAGMTYRYLFLLLQTAEEMFEARRARLVGVLQASDRRRLLAGTVGVLLDKSLHLSSEVHAAMQARGYRGEVHLLEDIRMLPADWLRLGAAAGISVLAIWFGR
jgi:cobalt/nickel transport system permease protein